MLGAGGIANALRVATTLIMLLTGLECCAGQTGSDREEILEMRRPHLHDDEGGPHAKQAAQAESAGHSSQHNGDASEAQAGAPGDQDRPGPGTGGQVAQR